MRTHKKPDAKPMIRRDAMSVGMFIANVWNSNTGKLPRLDRGQRDPLPIILKRNILLRSELERADAV